MYAVLCCCGVTNEQINNAAVMCVDIPLCRGLVDVKIDPHRLNCVEFVWDPRPQVETKVSIKIHCISTEFTAKKHGGEKGVPFRIQVETYTHSEPANDHIPVLLHCASCQVKVFKVCLHIARHSNKLVVTFVSAHYLMLIINYICLDYIRTGLLVI